MKIQAILNEGCIFLSGLKIETAVLDATVLLAEALQVSKEKLFAMYNQEIDPLQHDIYKTYLELRRNGYPVSYIRKKKEFYDVEFYVDNRVLVPRPDTEALVETAAGIIRTDPQVKTIHDLCTGSGCIAIILKKLFPGLHISASDISPGAGEVFRINCLKILGCVIPFVTSDLFTRITGKFNMITANPPYIQDGEYEQMQNINWPEPEAALRGGKDGLAVTSRLIKTAADYLEPGGYLVLESAYNCMKQAPDLLYRTGFTGIKIQKDLGNRERVITGRRS